MKKIYEFTITKKEKVQKQVKETVNDEEVLVTREVEEDVDHNFFIKYPGRSLRDEAQLFYSAAVNKAIKNGVMSVAMLTKRYVDDDGIYSEKEQKEIERLQDDLKEATDEKSKITAKKKPSAKDKSRLKELNETIAEISEKVIVMSQHEQDIFRNTAEYYAQTKTVMYWIAFLAYNGDETPFFGDRNSSLDERLDRFDEIDQSDDEFLQEVIRKFTFLVSFWTQNQGAKKEDFDMALKSLEDESA